MQLMTGSQETNRILTEIGRHRENVGDFIEEGCECFDE
jgi:hypothetical protein